MYDREARDRAGGPEHASTAAPAPGKQTRVDEELLRMAARGLRSPRFAGDPTLEACAADRARLTTGARGASVAKVQQALVDLGYAIGDGGVDGVYGSSLWDAVKQLKRNEQLGWETMGDVGPGTMHRLDGLLPGPPAPSRQRTDEAEDGGQTTARDYVLTRDDDADTRDGPVIPPAPDPSAMLAMMMAQPGPIAAGAAATSEPAGHLSIIEAVKKFKAKLDVPGLAGDNLTEHGQFFWGREVGAAVMAEIKAIRTLPGTDDFALPALWAHDEALNYGDPGRPLRLAARAANASKSAARPRMLALVHGFTGGAGTLEDELWAALAQHPDGALPDLTRYRSLVTLRTLRLFDKLACGSHMLFAAQRVKQRGGLNARDPKVPPFAAALASGDGVRDRRPVDGLDRHLGDVVTQSGVSSAVARMKIALDAGQLIEARVLSGVGVGKVESVPAEPRSRRQPIKIPKAGEHSILIIGYDDDRFVFNDPDAGESIQPAPGFGTLHFDGARLTTALDDADLKVDDTGHHVVGDHRYQVLSLRSV